jgi:hypothetical protein
VELRECLQMYSPPNGITLQKNWLTLHDLGELIKRAGLACGFVVQSEFKVEGGDLDWVWLANPSKRPIVAFEIEGPNAGQKKSLKRDFRKFALCKARINVLALFQVDHDHSAKAQEKKLSLDGVHEKVARLFSQWREENKEYGNTLDTQPEVFRDCALMEGGIEKLQRRAEEVLDVLGIAKTHSHMCCTSPNTPSAPS